MLIALLKYAFTTYWVSCCLMTGSFLMIFEASWNEAVVAWGRISVRINGLRAGIRIRDVGNAKQKL